MATKAGSVYVRAAREARHNCIELAREFPGEATVFVRLAQQWHEFVLRRMKLERINKDIESEYTKERPDHE